MASQQPRAAPPLRPPPPRGVSNQSAPSAATSTGLGLAKDLHDEAYLYIHQGLTLDEIGQSEQAVTLYAKGLSCIDIAIDTLCSNESPVNPAHNHQVQVLADKMLKTKGQIQMRIQELLSSDAAVARAIADPPPSYEATMTPTGSDGDLALSASLMEDNLEGAGLSSASATQLYSIPDGVQIFYITTEGYVSAPSYPSGLAIYKFRERPQSTASCPTPPAFLRVGEWTFPLLPGRSPVLHADFGAYIFPDVTSDREGCSVGVILPDTVTDRSQFERVLNSFTDMRTQAADAASASASAAAQSYTRWQRPQAAPAGSAAAGAATRGSVSQATEKRTREGPVVCPGEAVGAMGGVAGEAPEQTSTKIAKGLETMGEWISWGLVKGAEKTGDLLKKGSDKLRERITPEEEKSKIDPRAQKGLYYTREASDVAVRVSAFAVKKLGQGTLALARVVAPHLKAGGEKMLPQSLTQRVEGQPSKLEGACEVAKGGIRTWATVFTGLEQAARALAGSISSETVNIVQHKYGKDAGQFTENVLHSGGNIGMTVYTATNLGPKAIAKTVAKNTGVTLMHEVHKDTDATKVKQVTEAEKQHTECVMASQVNGVDGAGTLQREDSWDMADDVSVASMESSNVDAGESDRQAEVDVELSATGSASYRNTESGSRQQGETTRSLESPSGQGRNDSLEVNVTSGPTEPVTTQSLYPNIG